LTQFRSKVSQLIIQMPVAHVLVATHLTNS
jgi:hypothetical protein